MKLLKESYYRRKLSEEEVDKAYELAQKEIDEKSYSKGLMAKSVSISKGDQEKAKAKYISLRTQQILSSKLKEETVEQTSPIWHFESDENVIVFIIAILMILLFFIFVYS